MLTALATDAPMALGFAIAHQPNSMHLRMSFAEIIAYGGLRSSTS